MEQVRIIMGSIPKSIIQYYTKINVLIERVFSMEGDKRDNVLKMLELIGDMLGQDMFWH